MKNILRILYILLVFSFAFAKYHIVIVAGQSNCLNIHTRATALPICESDSLVPFFYDVYYPPSFAPNDLVTSSDNLWEKLKVHERETATGPGYAFFGPEITLARTLSEHMDSVAIFKFGIAGSDLANDWGLDDNGSRKGFSEFIQKIRISEQALTDVGHDYEWIAMTWMQGESDAERQTDASNYYRNLGYFIKQVRDSLDSPTLPVVVGAIADELPLGPYPYRETILDAQQRRCEKDENAYYVNTADYPMDTDNVHFNSQGVMTLGMAFADTILALKTVTAVSNGNTLETMDFVYPNPVNGRVKVEFSLGAPEHVRLELYNLSGRRIVNQDYGILDANFQKLDLDLNTYPSGLYILSIVAGDFRHSEKISLVK